MTNNANGKPLKCWSATEVHWLTYNLKRDIKNWVSKRETAQGLEGFRVMKWKWAGQSETTKNFVLRRCISASTDIIYIYIVCQKRVNLRLNKSYLLNRLLQGMCSLCAPILGKAVFDLRNNYAHLLEWRSNPIFPLKNACHCQFWWVLVRGRRVGRVVWPSNLGAHSF